MTARGLRAGPTEGLAARGGRRLAQGGLRTPRGPGVSSFPGDAEEDSREHRDGRPNHAVGEAAPLHVHGGAAGAVKLLLVRLGRRRRLHFRHSGRGWQRRQQERRTPFRFRHAARVPLRRPLLWPRSPRGVTSWRWGPLGLAFPPGIGAAALWAGPAWSPDLGPRQPRWFALTQHGCGRDALRQRAV